VIEEVPEVTSASATNNDLEYCVNYGDDNDNAISFYDWLADSCMTSHICNSRDAFKTYENLADAAVRGVSNITTKALGCRTVRLCSRVNDKSYTLILQDVLHVPTSQYNLLSLGKWDKSCGNFSVNCGCLSLAKRDGKVIALGQRLRSNLYKMCLHVQHKYTCDSDSPHRNIACSADVPQSWEMWHKRFGHISYQGLQELQCRDLVKGLKINV
jgi:GAG-pre-integrase domain